MSAQPLPFNIHMWTAPLVVAFTDDHVVAYRCRERERERGRFASLLQAQGDLTAARPLFERALAIQEKALGPEHPYACVCPNNLSSVLRDQGDLAAARPLYERSLAICEKALGPEHRITVRVRSNYVRLLLAAGQRADASALAEALRARYGLGQDG
jgi:hypothetical protein